MNNLQKDILNKIKAGEIDMKPRWHFVLKGVLLFTGVVLVTLVAVYLLSLIIFVLKSNGLISAPLYGFRGISLFVLGSPWLLIISAGLFLTTLYLLVSQYAFSYRRPLIYSLLGAIALVIIGSFVFLQTGSHEQLRQHGLDNNRPVLHALYGRADETDRGVTSGVITSVTENGLTIKVPNGNTVSVIVSESTRFRSGQTWAVDEKVMVFGKEKNNVIEAIGIRPTPLDQRPSSPPRPKR